MSSQAPHKKEDEKLANEKGKPVYYQDGNGYWESCSYDSHGNKISSKNCYGDIEKWTYHANNNLASYYLKDSDGYWEKHVYDTNGCEIYYEDSKGDIKKDIKNKQ